MKKQAAVGWWVGDAEKHKTIDARRKHKQLKTRHPRVHDVPDPDFIIMAKTYETTILLPFGAVELDQARQMVSPVLRSPLRSDAW